MSYSVWRNWTDSVWE